MELSELGIWQKLDTRAWVRSSASRWSALTLRIARLYMELFSASSLPRAETELLFVLLTKDGERAEASVVARELRFSKQGMTGLVDRLEAAGYVRRVAHASDRRKKLVVLTPSGVAFVKKVATRVMGRAAAIIASFNRATIENTMETMESICAKAEEMHDDESI